MMRRRGLAALAGAALLALSGCGKDAGPAPSPPTLQAVGVATDVRFYQDHTRFVFADGTVQVVPASYRQIGESPGFGLIIIGLDDTGPFVASFPTQAGLPADCYRENRTGIERGAYIEMEGVLWAKAPSFTSAAAPENGSAYPGGTRFCFNDRGLVAGVVDGSSP
jgi:hypothetical protein